MNTKQRRFYISGKISGLPIDKARYNFDYASIKVVKYYRATYIVNPFHIKPFMGINSWLCYMINDIRKQRHCTHTVMLPDWKDSKGACIEHFLAKFVFKHKVVYL
jgi:hypothetical protein